MNFFFIAVSQFMVTYWNKYGNNNSCLLLILTTMDGDLKVWYLSHKRCRVAHDIIFFTLSNVLISKIHYHLWIFFWQFCLLKQKQMSPVSACQSCSAVIGNFLVLWHTVYKYICCLKDSSIAMIGQLSWVKIIRNGKISNLTESQHKHPKPVSLIRQYFLSHRCQE